MPYFRADVIDQSGKSRRVHVEANDEKHALERLRKRNLFPTAIVQDDPPAAPAPASAPIAPPQPAFAQPAPTSDVAALQAELAKLRDVQQQHLNIAKRGTSFGSHHRTFALLLIAFVICWFLAPIAIGGDPRSFQNQQAYRTSNTVFAVLIGSTAIGWVAYGLRSTPRARTTS